MNNENLKKLLKSVEICENPNKDPFDCHGCPFAGEKDPQYELLDWEFKSCGMRQYMLAKSLLHQMDKPAFTPSHYTTIGADISQGDDFCASLDDLYR